MPGMNDAGAAGERFSVVARKHRAALTKDERRLIALGKAASQAVLALNNHKQAVAAMTDRLVQLEEGAVAAQREFDAAKAALEAK